MADLNSFYPSMDELKKIVERDDLSFKKATTSPYLQAAGKICALLTILFIFSLIFLPWIQTVSGAGNVIAYSPNDRIQTISAPIDGRIVQWHVVEGTSIKKGDPLVNIADIDPNILERLQTEKEAVEQRVSAMQRSAETSNKNLLRQQELFTKGLSSQRAVELANLEYAKFQADLSSAQAELARLETRISRQSSQMVTAPVDGIIQRVIALQGGMVVKQGADLATIVPATSDRAVQLYVKGVDIPLITTGREVRIQFEGWPAVQFSGWPSVAVGTFGGVVANIDPSDDGEGNFRIIVIPSNNNKWPDHLVLRQGIRAVGFVLLDEVKIGWELWRRFNGFPVSLKSKKESKESSKSKK